MSVIASAVRLRPYQLEAIEAVEKATVKRLLILLPTGTGKTIAFAELLRRRGDRGRGLVLAHRDELIEQAVAKIAAVAPDLKVGVVKAERDEIEAPIIVASVQTLSRPARLARLGRDFGTIVVDECHHAIADSYTRILEHLGALDADGPLVVGVTATAERADGTPLGEIFEEIVFRRDLLSMIRDGFLCDLRAVRVSIKVNLDLVHTRGGDFAVDELDDALRNANAPRHAVSAYQQHAPGRKALVFTPSVALAHEMGSAFRNAGIAAEALDGSTRIEDRRAILARLHSGETRVVANCGVLTEGFDEPSIDCIIVARPTQSRPLYVQMIGRGTRLHPGKPDCLIVDLVGNSKRHELVSCADLFGVPPELLDDGELTVCEAIEHNAKSSVADDDGELVASGVDLFRNRRFRWVQVDDTCYALTIADGQIMLRSVDGSGWTAERVSRTGSRATIGTDLDLGYAQGVAEDHARQLRADILSRADAPWRRQPASNAQIHALRRWGLRPPANLNKGEASDLLIRAAAAARRRA